VTTEDAKALVASVPHWHHRFEIAPGVVTPGTYDPQFLLDKLSLPKDLRDRRVLDVGASDGFFSLALRRRGAEVVSVDYRPKDLHGFAVMERLSGLAFDYRQCNVYDMSPGALGSFDCVLFLGVIYHLPDPIRALGLLRSLCTGTLFIESHCSRDLSPEIAAARYYRGDSLAGDPTNFWSPNVRCFGDMLHDSAFDVVRSETWGDRYFAECRANAAPDRLAKLALAYGLIG